MKDKDAGIRLLHPEDVNRLPDGSLIEGFIAENGGYWWVDPAPLAEEAAKLILEKDKENKRPVFPSKAAVVLYAVEQFDFQGRRSRYEKINLHSWRERIQRYQRPMSAAQAAHMAGTLAYKEFRASGQDDFEAYKATAQQQELKEERIARLQESGMSEEEALLIAPSPDVSDTPSGLFRGADMPRLRYGQTTAREAARIRQQVTRQLQEEGLTAARPASGKTWVIDRDATKDERTSWVNRTQANKTHGENSHECP